MIELDTLSPEAHSLYTLFGELVNDNWQSVLSFGDQVAMISRWLPQPSWRPIWQELGVHKLIAYSVRGGTECVSRWRNRFDPTLLLTINVRQTVARYYTDWQPFNWDNWNDVLLTASIQTEALWQLNHALCVLTKHNIVELRDRGSQIRCTQENLSWILNQATT